MLVQEDVLQSQLAIVIMLEPEGYMVVSQNKGTPI